MKGLGYVIWLIAIVGLVAACQAAPELRVGDPGNVPVGGSIEIPITLEGAENGLSGYNLTVTLSDPACAEISAVSFPAWAPLHRGGAVPAGATWIEGVDLGDRAEGNGTSVALGTITLRGIRGGPTDLVIAPVRVQDDTGTSYQISEVKTGLMIGSASESQSGSSGNSGSSGSSSVPAAAVTTPQPTPTEESTQTVTTSEVPSTATGTPEETTPAQGASPFLIVLMIAALIFGFITREKKE
ncbi:hypothetical protein RJ40_11295 [Methanofollis aquaemaris]|uniref:Cohesin domain-containing protein n=1 Tax=Methanofollis aquaemaris TaxID=126734 RepID=A0A8A3S6Y3_9EURY|nr:hypothetical protein [Methanofollis aquaemaris]QSZ68037.1 hypothetical protein RJ40_11295 [Methanofollis aquaemaris]